MSKQATLERRRAERIAAQRAEAARELRGRRLKRLGAAAVAAIAAVAVAAAVSSSGGSPAAESPATTASLFAGLPEKDGVVGDPKAPLTVTEYVDLQCPVCAQAASDALPAVVRDYVRTGKVKLAARTLHFLGPDSVRAARVAAGAERQGKLWPFLEAFYARQGAENSGYVTDGFLREVAGAAGVDAKAALGQAGSSFASQRLARANADASRLGIDATPTLTVRREGGPERVLDASALDPASVAAALDRELAR
jgi:protein-disulfide isomerase